MVQYTRQNNQPRRALKNCFKTKQLKRTNTARGRNDELTWSGLTHCRWPYVSSSSRTVDILGLCLLDMHFFQLPCAGDADAVVVENRKKRKVNTWSRAERQKHVRREQKENGTGAVETNRCGNINIVETARGYLTNGYRVSLLPFLNSTRAERGLIRPSKQTT